MVTATRGPRTRIQIAGHRRARALRRDLAAAIRVAREDAGLSQGQLARAAGISDGTVSKIEADVHEAGFEVLARICEALGGRFTAYFQPGTGPAIRDHLQSAMLQELVAIAHRRWQRALEVNVYSPVRGVIDVVLEDPLEPVAVAGEAHSLITRVEQQVRWANAKADALAQARRDTGVVIAVSRLLLLRSTSATRQLAATHADLLAAAYPAKHEAAVAALTGTEPWPGAAIVWCTVKSGRARIEPGPPRGVRIGR